jgi:cysteine synthase A
MTERLGEIWSQLWAKVLDNRNKLTTTGGVIVGVLLTLAFKDFYPDLEHTFRNRLRRARTNGHSLPSHNNYIQIRDDTDRDELLKARTPSLGGNALVAVQGVPTGIEGLIGNTPLIRLGSLSEVTGCEILVKAEFLNGAGNSPKDRVALAMIANAEAEGLLVPGRGDTIYEGTVGSTGISLAAVCRARGYKAYMYVDPHTFRKTQLMKFVSAVCPMTKLSRRATFCSSWAPL